MPQGAYRVHMREKSEAQDTKHYSILCALEFRINNYWGNEARKRI